MQPPHCKAWVEMVQGQDSQAEGDVQAGCWDVWSSSSLQGREAAQWMLAQDSIPGSLFRLEQDLKVCHQGLTLGKEGSGQV